MSHLDEGMIHALLDGEIPSAELPPIQAHLGACAECRARLAEEQELLETSDRLIELIEVPAAGATAAARPVSPVHRIWSRNLAWAATVVLAAGIGYWTRGSVRPGPEANNAVEQKRAVAETVFARSPEPVVPAEPAAQERGAALTSQDRAGASTRKPAREQAGVQERLDRAKAAEPPSSARAADVAATPPPAPRVVATESTTTRPLNQAPAAAAPPAAANALRAARRLGEVPNRLEEIVVTGAAESRLGRLAAASAISFPDAIRKLGGTLRLIEGLIPHRLEAVGDTIRVVYPTGFGDLVLSQRLEHGTLRYTLIAPRDFPADSVEKLRARIRE